MLVVCSMLSARLRHLYDTGTSNIRSGELLSTDYTFNISCGRYSRIHSIAIVKHHSLISLVAAPQQVNTVSINFSPTPLDRLDIPSPLSFVVVTIPEGSYDVLPMLIFNLLFGTVWPTTVADVVLVSLPYRCCFPALALGVSGDE